MAAPTETAAERRKRMESMTPKMRNAETKRLLSSLDEAQLECQAGTHLFRRIDPDDTLIPSSWHLGTRAFVVMRRCLSCQTVKVLVYDSYTGERRFGTYLYPEGWTHFTGLGTPPKAFFVRELVRREMKALPSSPTNRRKGTSNAA